MKILNLSILILSFFLVFNKANATLNIDIKDDGFNKTKILFIGFESRNNAVDNEAKQILQKIISNLKTTNLIESLVQNKIQQSFPIQQSENPSTNTSENSNQTLPDNALKVSLTDINETPDFEKYSQAGIEGLILAQVNHDRIGNLEIRIRMWDILDRKQTFGKFYSTSSDNYRKTANIISDEIYKSITGETKGHFTSQITFVSETGNYRKRIKKISLIDFDGHNYRNLTDGKEIVLTPIFSKHRDEIYYSKYFQGRPQIFNLNTETLRSQKIGGFRSTTFSPSIHPKSADKILLTVIENGNSDIHELNIAQNFAKKLTKSPSIETTASYSPNSNSIAFISDRDGPQEIFILDLDSLDQKKISNGDGSYSKPVWSPDGKLIAFTKQKGNKFFLGIMNSNGRSEKLLTSAYLIDGARWSPSGRYLIYSKKLLPYGQKSIPRIFIIDIITGYEHEIPTPPDEGATDPDWK